MAKIVVVTSGKGGVGKTTTSASFASGLALLCDLRECYASAHRTEISWIMLQQAAKATRDEELLDIANNGAAETEQTWKWLRTRVKDATPQALAAG